MSRKRGKQQKAAVEAVPDDVLAEGSGPVRSAEVDAVTTVEDVVTTDDIATTDDVVTPDDVVATAGDPDPSDDAPPRAREADEAADGDDGDGGDAAMAADGEAGEPMEGGEAAEAADGDEEDAGVVFPTSAASMDASQIKHLVEALIFASDRPLTVQRLRQLTRVGDVRRLEQALVEIAEDFRERGIVLQQVSGGYQFRTRTQFSAWVQQLIAGRPVRLSRAQLETLAIIAYRQPITRPEIDDIRGVDSSATLKLLIDRMLIRALGKREEVGRPTLYGTTKEFLDFFSLGDLRELPTLREYSELTAESRKVMSDRLGVAADGEPGGGGGGSNDDGSGGSSGGDDGGGNDGGGGPAGDGGGGDGSLGGAGPAGGEPLPDDGAPAHGSPAERADASPAEMADALEPLLSSQVEAASDEVVAAGGEVEAAADEIEAAPDELEAAPDEIEAAPDEVEARPEELDHGDGDSDPGHRLDGRVGDAAEWPAGSEGVEVVASTDDRPVERPVMEPEALDADALEATSSNTSVTPVPYDEPAAE